MWKDAKPIAQYWANCPKSRKGFLEFQKRLQVVDYRMAEVEEAKAEVTALKKQKEELEQNCVSSQEYEKTTRQLKEAQEKLAAAQGEIACLHKRYEGLPTRFCDTLGVVRQMLEPFLAVSRETWGTFPMEDQIKITRELNSTVSLLNPLMGVA